MNVVTFLRHSALCHDVLFHTYSSHEMIRCVRVCVVPPAVRRLRPLVLGWVWTLSLSCWTTSVRDTPRSRCSALTLTSAWASPSTTWEWGNKKNSHLINPLHLVPLHFVPLCSFLIPLTSYPHLLTSLPCTLLILLPSCLISSYLMPLTLLPPYVVPLLLHYPLSCTPLPHLSLCCTSLNSYLLTPYLMPLLLLYSLASSLFTLLPRYHIPHLLCYPLILYPLISSLLTLYPFTS